MNTEEKKTIDTDYELIPMSEITDEAREIAVRWGDNMKDDFIAQKHKLASDIMNYARRYKNQFKPTDQEIEKMTEEAISHWQNTGKFTTEEMMLYALKQLRDKIFNP